MSVKTYYGDGYKDPSSLLAIVANKAEASLKSIYSKFSLLSGDSSGSQLLVGRVPSSARLFPALSSIVSGGVAGLTSFSLGLGKDGAVVNSKGAALMSAVDIHTAGSYPAMSAIAAGSLGQPAWQLAGYAANPGGMIDIIASTGADASGAGTIEANIVFAK